MTVRWCDDHSLLVGDGHLGASHRRTVCSAAKWVETSHNLPWPSREASRRADRTSCRTRGRSQLA